MSIINVPSTPATPAQIAQAHRDNRIAVRFVVAYVLTLVLVVAGLTLAGVITPAADGPLGTDPAPVSWEQGCASDAECAVQDAETAASHGVTLAVDPAEPTVTPLVTVTPDGGIRTGCAVDGAALIDTPHGVACR